MYMVAFLALRVLYMVALPYSAFVSWFSLLNPLLAMMSFAGYLHAASSCLLSSLFVLSYFVLFFSDRVRPRFVLV